MPIFEIHKNRYLDKGFWAAYEYVKIVNNVITVIHPSEYESTKKLTNIIEIFLRYNSFVESQGLTVRRFIKIPTITSGVFLIKVYVKEGLYESRCNLYESPELLKLVARWATCQDGEELLLNGTRAYKIICAIDGTQSDYIEQ